MRQRCWRIGGQVHQERGRVQLHEWTVCFELLTEIPFEDNHLQGAHMSKNVHAGMGTRCPGTHIRRIPGPRGAAGHGAAPVLIWTSFTFVVTNPTHAEQADTPSKKDRHRIETKQRYRLEMHQTCTQKPTLPVDGPK